jgi:flagellar assembly protein FliH
MFSEEEVNMAREAAFDEGRRSGFSEGQEDAGIRIAQTIEALTAALPMLAEEQARTNALILTDAVKLSLAAVKKALPAMAEKYAFEEVSKVVADLVPHLLDEPRIIVRVALPLVESIRTHLEQVAKSAGFEGRVVVQDDERLGAGDCKVEWADGGGERDLARLMSEMDQVVERALASGSE